MSISPETDEEIRVATFTGENLLELMHHMHQWISCEPLDTRNFVDMIAVLNLTYQWNEVEMIWVGKVYYRFATEKEIDQSGYRYCINP